MKTVYKFLALGLMMVAFAAANVGSTFAQDDQAIRNDLYEVKFKQNYKGDTDEKRKIAIDAAKQYIAKFESNPDDKEIVDYLKKQIVKLQKVVDDNARFGRFNTSVPAKNWNDAFASGKEILADNPDNVDVMLILASIGFDQSAANPPVTTYNADALNYARMAIQKIEAGKTSENYGAFTYTYKTKDFPDGKNNALGWMNYTIGYIMYYRQNQKKEALPYIYKATQLNSETKNFADIYRMLGAWYVEETARLEKDRQDKIKVAGDTDTDETKAIFALQKGYTDRAIDAYGRAYKIASANPKATKEYKDGLYKTLKDLYAFRYDGKTDTLDTYIAGVMNKPLPDPTTAVTPVVQTTPATTTGGATPSTTTPVATKKGTR